MTSDITNEAVENISVQSDVTEATATETETVDPADGYLDLVTSEKYKKEHEDYVAHLVEMGIRRYAESSETIQPDETPNYPLTDTTDLGQGARLHMRRVKQGARETSRLYPEFDLKREMKDPLFLKLTVATGGDTTAAYVARHYDEILRGRVRAAEKRGAEAVAASIRSGGVRPAEGALSKGGAVVEKRDPAKLSLGDFKRIRENFRKTGKRERF